MNTKQQVLTQLNTVPSNFVVFEIVKAFVLLMVAESVVLESIIEAAVERNWADAKTKMKQIVTFPEFALLRQFCSQQGLNSIALVTGTEFSFVLGLKGLVGLLTGTKDITSFYSYESVGVSVGVQEGVTLVTGLLLSTAEPSDAGETDFFVEMAGDFGGGVAVERFVSINGSQGYLILSTLGEEFAANMGVGYSWVDKI